jgi:hypothetical protein
MEQASLSRHETETSLQLEMERLPLIIWTEGG